jgi:predicted 2-oxoglutarate/Fe(II)-dependent dioxygenase YbiX
MLHPLSPGALITDLYGVDTHWVFYSLQGQAGRPVVMILALTIDAPGLKNLIEAFSARAGEFAALGADIVVIVKDKPEELFQYSAAHPCAVTMVACQAATFFAAVGFEREQPLVLILNRGMRISHAIEPVDADPVARSLAGLATLATEEARDIVLPAPVLMLHNLIDPAFCRALIGEFENGENFDSGMAGVDAGGGAKHKIDHAKKKRRDHLLNPGDRYYNEVQDVLLGACAHEMKKAFQADITHCDRIVIARYDVGDQFKRHVDNAAPQVAFRQFAISLNLNAGEYQGGHLTFPEFSPHRYSPPTGSGVIFSSSVLHEAAPVTEGHRYVLLTFLHNKEAELRRLGLA